LVIKKSPSQNYSGRIGRFDTFINTAPSGTIFYAAILSKKFHMNNSNAVGRRFHQRGDMERLDTGIWRKL
jgi:hypothetical protein